MGALTMFVLTLVAGGVILDNFFLRKELKIQRYIAGEQGQELTLREQRIAVLEDENKALERQRDSLRNPKTLAPAAGTRYNGAQLRRIADQHNVQWINSLDTRPNSEILKEQSNG